MAIHPQAGNSLPADQARELPILAICRKKTSVSD